MTGMHQKVEFPVYWARLKIHARWGNWVGFPCSYEQIERAAMKLRSDLMGMWDIISEFEISQTPQLEQKIQTVCIESSLEDIERSHWARLKIADHFSSWVKFPGVSRAHTNVICYKMMIDLNAWGIKAECEISSIMPMEE